MQCLLARVYQSVFYEHQQVQNVISFSIKKNLWYHYSYFMVKLPESYSYKDKQFHHFFTGMATVIKWISPYQIPIKHGCPEVIALYMLLFPIYKSDFYI